MIPPHIIDKIFDAAAIEEVVGEYVSLKKAGANYKGLCPFHDDKNPSMSVSPSKGIFKCFSCGKGGNSVHFIMEHEGLSYPLALKFLADKYGIEIEEKDFNAEEIEEEGRRKDGIFASLEFAKNYFRDRLNGHEQGRVVFKPYLKERGIRDDTIERFGLGLSGMERTELLNAGVGRGFTAQQLFDAGLVKKIKDEEGVLESNLRDTFIERIVFPIHNISGKVLGFGGRIIKTDTKAPKYLNSPETQVYEKRKVLYGLFQAKNAIRKTDVAYLVEGYMDVISLSQSGVENVVAVSGTSFTEEQARLLKRFTKNAVLLFDGDEAGVNASMKHIQTLLSNDMNAKVVLFPETEDPDSYIQKNGKSGFEEFVQNQAKNFVEFIVAVKLKGKVNDPLSKAEVARTLTENIAQIPDPLKRTAFVNEAARLLEWNERSLIEETNKFRLHNLKKGRGEDSVYVPQFETAENPLQEADTRNHQEYDMLKALILYADKEFDEEQTVAQLIFKEIKTAEIEMESKEVAQIFEMAKDQLKEGRELNPSWFLRHPISSKITAEFLSSAYDLSHGWEERYEKFIKTEEDNYKKIVVENLNYLKLSKLQSAIAANQEMIKAATTDEEILTHQNIHLRLQDAKKKITEIIGAVVIK